MDEQWVQSKYSTEGEKFQVLKDVGAFWHCVEYAEGCHPWLPKSEYIKCPPPERWERVEAVCDHAVDAGLSKFTDGVKYAGSVCVDDPDRYRVVSVVLEKKVD